MAPILLSNGRIGAMLLGKIEMVVVKIEGYDCCALTHSIWVNPNLPKGSALWSKSLGNFDDDREPTRLVLALKKKGFKQVEVQTFSYGGNY